MHRSDWDGYRFVLAACRLGSVARVAEALDVNESTVLRRLARAERELGAKLVSRANGELVPTDAGARALRHLERVDAELDALHELVDGDGQRVAGSVRVTAVPMLVNHVLIDASRPLLERHPELRLKLVAENANLSIGRHETDIAVRMARPSSDLDALTRKLGDLGYGVFCRRDALGEHAALPWITHEPRAAEPSRAVWFRARTEAERSVARLSVNDAESVLRCLLAGIGKSVVPRALARLHPSLAEIDSVGEVLSREVWMLMHPSYKSRRRMDVVAAWVEDSVQAFIASAPATRSGAGSGPGSEPSPEALDGPVPEPAARPAAGLAPTA